MVWLETISLVVSAIGALGMVMYIFNRTFFRPKIHFREAQCHRQEDYSYLFDFSYEKQGWPVEVVEGVVAYPAHDVLVISDPGRGSTSIDSPVLSQSATKARIGWQISTPKSPIYLDVGTVAVASLHFVPYRRTKVRLEVLLKARVCEDRLCLGVDMFPPMIKTIKSKVYEFDVEPPPFDFRLLIQKLFGYSSLVISRKEWINIVDEARIQTN